MNFMFQPCCRVPRTRFSQPTSQAEPHGSDDSVNQRSSSLVGRMVSQNPSQYFPAPRQHREQAFSNSKQIFGYSPNILNTPTERISRLRPKAPQPSSSGLEKELERLKMNPEPAIIRDQGQNSILFYFLIPGFLSTLISRLKCLIKLRNLLN